MIYFIRHGETAFDLEGRIEGRWDSALAEKGREQATAMGGLLRELLGQAKNFEVLSSPQSRACDSAQIVREKAGLEGPVITDTRLLEVDCGSWEKHHFSTICERDPLVAEAPGFLSA